MVIEQVPLPLELHDAVVVGPAAVLVLGHDDALEIPGSQGRARHGVSQRLCPTLLPHPGEGQVIPVAPAEGEGAFLEPLGQSLHRLSAHQHRHGRYAVVATGQRHLLQLAVQLCHIALQTGSANAHAAPVEVCRTVVVYEHTGVDAADATYGLLLQAERPCGRVACGYADGESPTRHGCIGEVEVVAPVLLHTVGCPHRVGVLLSPGHLLLAHYDAMVLPLGQVVRREYVVVGHAEPVLPLPLGRHDVVRGVQVYAPVEHPRRRVGSILVANNGVLCPAAKCQPQNRC